MSEVESSQEAAEAAAAEGAQDEAESPLAVLEREHAELRDNYLRLAAELDNMRKRGARELESARRYGVERLALALLPVLDSLEAALSAENLDLEASIEGQRAILRQLQTAFEGAGVAPIEPEGEPFDPNFHEAMSMLPAAHAEPGSVLTVIQKGYALSDRLLRPARVIVAREPDGGETSQ